MATLTIKETAIASPAVAGAMNLPRQEFGLIFALRGEERVTLAGDVDYVRMLREAASTAPDALAEMKIPKDLFPLARPGWPDD